MAMAAKWRCVLADGERRLVKDAFDLRGSLMMELSVLDNFLLLILIARLLVHSDRGHQFGSYLFYFLIFFPDLP